MTTKAIPSSLEVFGENVRRMAESVGSGFTEPDDDWMAVLIVEAEDGKNYAFGMAGDLFDGEEKKDGLVFFLHDALREVGAVRYAFVLSAWAIRSPKEEGMEAIEAIHAEWRGRFEDHPERTEQLILHVVDREHEFGLMADIERHQDKPPTLGKWSKIDGMEGRFPSLRDSLRHE